MAKAGSQGGVKGAGDKPVKPRAKTYSMGRDVPIEENLQELAKIVATPPNRKTVISRTDALYHLWTLAAADSEKRGEMLDVLLAAVLVKLINISSDETLKYNAIGCLQLISTDEDGCRQIAKAKAQPQGKSGVTVIAELMHGTHDRSKISAAAILYEMSTHYELMHDLIPVIPAMLRLIDHEDPEWSGIKKSHAYIATAIRNLLFNINQEQASQARVQLFKHGGIPRLVALLKRGPKEAATSAVACLRDLAPHPDMVDVIVESEGIQNLIMLLEHGVEEQKALASACMCELSTHDCCQDVMVACGALIPLVKCLSWAVSTTTAQAAALGRKGRRKRQGHTGSKRSPPLPPAIDMAVTNASATLYHLSFIDQVKVSIRECGAIPLLVSLLHANNFIIQENVTGCLWNMALEPSNHQFLVGAHCPPHLLAPLHPNWLTPLDNPHTPYAGGNSLVAAKPRSAPPKAGRGSRGSRGSDKSSVGGEEDGDPASSAGMMGFRRGGGGAMHPPRTPEETARAATPPRRRKPNLTPVHFPKIAHAAS